MDERVIHDSHDPEPADGPPIYPGSRTCRRCCRFVAFGEGDSPERVTEQGAAPCDPVAVALRNPTGAPFVELEDGRVASLMGVLAGLERHESEQGPYLTGELRREGDTVPIDVPPRIYCDYGGFLVEGLPLVVAGFVDHRLPGSVFMVRMVALTWIAS